MDKLFADVSEDLYKCLELYMDNKIEIDELYEAERKVILVLNYNKWSKIKEELKEDICRMTLELHNKIEECEILVLLYERITQSNTVEIEEDELLSSSSLIGRNRAPPIGFEHSTWFLPAFPTIQLIEALEEDDTHIEI